MKLKTFKMEFLFDTGATHVRKVAFAQAENKEKAEEMVRNWAYSYYDGNYDNFSIVEIEKNQPILFVMNK